MEVSDGAAASDFLKGHSLVGAQSEFALQLFALVRYFTGFLFRLKHVERVACRRRSVQTENEHGGCRTGFLDALVAFVEHRLDSSVVGSGKYYVAYAQCAVVDKYGGYISATLIERGFYDGSGGRTRWIGLQVEHFGFQKHFLHEFLYSDSFFSRDVLRLIFSAPVLDKVVHGGKFLLDFVGIGCRLVNLVYGEYDRNSGRGCVVDCFYGLRHHIVVGGYDDDT